LETRSERAWRRGFVVNASAEDFDLGLDVVKPRVYLGKVIANGGEFSRAQSHQRVDETGNPREALGVLGKWARIGRFRRRGPLKRNPCRLA
jgi:hypothetical protein